ALLDRIMGGSRSEELVSDAIGNHEPVHLLGGETGPPSRDTYAQTLLGEDVPESLGSPQTRRDGNLFSVTTGRRHEVDDAVPARRHPGGDARPDDRGQHRSD